MKNLNTPCLSLETYSMLKSLFSIIVLNLFALTPAFSQCPAGDVHLTTQSEVDNFSAACTHLTGSLEIGPSSSIVNLSNLGNIQSIAGDLKIHNNTALTSADGLSSLTSVGGGVFIISNNALVHLDWLDDIGDLHLGAFNIIDNPALTSVEGPNAVQTMSDNFFVYNNPLLASFSGFGDLVTVDFAFWFRDTKITALTGSFASLSTVGSDFDLKNHSQLTSLNVFGSLVSVGGYVRLEDDPLLTDVSGSFNNLTSIGGDLMVSANPLVPTFDSFGNLHTAGSITFTDNTALTSLNWLDNITNQTLNGFFVCCNAALTSIEGPQNVQHLTNNFFIYNNPLLASFSGFSNLLTADYDVWFRDTKVPLLNGSFQNLNTVSRNFDFRNNTQLTSLNVFGNLVSVGGYFRLQNDPLLTDVSGSFNNLTSIGGDLMVIANPLVPTFDSFGNLHTAGGITFTDNTSLTSLNWLDNITNQTLEGFYVTGNTALTSIEGPQNVQHLTDNFFIYSNPLLASFSGFNNLVTADYDVWFRDTKVPLLNGSFQNLNTVSRNFDFRNNAQLTSLNVFGNLVSVGGYFQLQNDPLLTDVSGSFNNLTSIGGDLIVSANPLVPTFNSFGNLHTAGGITFTDNTALTSLNWLDNITNQTLEGFIVSGNSALTSIEGPQNVQHLTDNFFIYGNPLLASFSGLNNLVTVDYAFWFSDTKVTALTGSFENLSTVSTDFDFKNNVQLTSLHSFGNLVSTGGYFLFKNNPLLTNLNTFAGLNHVSGDFIIFNNATLVNCCAIYDLLNTPGAIGGTITIDGNQTGCDNIPQIYTYCSDADQDGYSILQGDCNDNNAAIHPGAAEICNGIDDNCNGIVDEHELVLSGPTDAVDANIEIVNPDLNHGDSHLAVISHFTLAAYTQITRELMKFDLSAIPNGATITSATLTLFGSDENGAVHYCYPNTAGNIMNIQRITQPWDEMTVTWNNQPNTTSSGQITTGSACAPNENLSVDLKTMIQWLNDHPSEDNGFMLRLPSEILDQRGVFGSSEHPNLALRPKLTIQYQVPITYYADADGDGFGDNTVSITTTNCTPPSGYVTSAGDCNDGNAAINPAATEICNGIDDNCDNVNDNVATWFKTYGGTGIDELAAMRKTPDGGYVMAGYSTSSNGDVGGNYGLQDYWVVKINAAGAIQWQQHYGGMNNDQANDIAPTSDGGYIVAGFSDSNSGDVSGNLGQADFWIVKINSSGVIQWKKNYGGSNYDEARSVQQCADGGYIVAGITKSADHDVTGQHGGEDFWVIKLDANGNLIWQKTLGGTLDESAFSVVQTSDGGFAIAGYAGSSDGNLSGNHGSRDYWLVKLNASGNLLWQKNFGGPGEDQARKLIQTADSGFAITGRSGGSGGDVSGYIGGASDVWIVKTDPSGNLQWQKDYGSNNSDDSYDIREAIGGGYLLTGYVGTGSGNAAGPHHGFTDVWIVKIDNLGNLVWENNYGGTNHDWGRAILQNPNGTIAVGAHTVSNDGDVVGNHGNRDYWIIERNANGTGSIPCNLQFSGTILWEHDDLSGVKTATVALTGPATANAVTDINGNYSISVPPAAGTYTLKPTKQINRMNGVNAADATAIQQHVAGTTLITDPYKLVAADVNKSNSVSNADASTITQCLLNNPAALLTFSTFWRFVPTTYTMPMPPWGFPESITVTNPTGPSTNKNFVGIKIGDVNGTALPSLQPWGASPLVWEVPDQLLQTGQTVTAVFRARQFQDIAAYQFALHFDPTRLQYSGLQTDAALPVTADNFGFTRADSGEIRAVWAVAKGASPAAGSPVFSLTFKVLNGGGRLSDVLGIDETELDAVAYTTDLRAQYLKLEYADPLSATTQPTETGNGLLLLQNRPNPFSNSTRIGFVLPQACAARLRVYDLNGRVLAETECDCAAGYQEQQIDLEDMPAGILYYELRTPLGIVTKKMSCGGG